VKVKLDENLGPRTAALIAGAGHDAATVVQERLSGTSVAEGRCLITLRARPRWRPSAVQSDSTEEPTSVFSAAVPQL
jgi:hypothetical protein